MQDIKTKIQRKASEIWSEIVEIRRYLHAHPELSFEEKETSTYVAAYLKKLGIEHQTGVGGYGIVGHIYGNNPESGMVALRADMDALPIYEENEVSYCSTNPGVMHACGHDVHTSNLLGVANILNSLKSEFSGTIRLIFQPAEEKFPGGASLMIAEGVLRNPVPDCIIGMHVYPQMEAGQAGLRPGPYMASADEIYVTVKGKGGHGALPHDTVDTVMITSQMINALQTIVSRSSDPTIPSVLTFGKIQSKGGATNVIPDEVYLEGTFRTMDEPWREKAHALIMRTANGVVEALGGTVDFNIVKGYPFLVNDPKLSQWIYDDMDEYLGKEHNQILPIRMTAEDFAYYCHHIPAVFFRIGTSNFEKKLGAPLHTSRFDVDEKCLETSTGLMSWCAIQRLNALKK